VGRKAGVTETKLMALADFEGSRDLTDLEKLAVRYAVEMTKTPVNVPDELFAELKRNLSDKQIVELTSAIAWENYRARNNHALGVESEGFSKGAFCPLPERR
jgi:alkylhydroperoxidase family enzyme